MTKKSYALGQKLFKNSSLQQQHFLSYSVETVLLPFGTMTQLALCFLTIFSRLPFYRPGNLKNFNQKFKIKLNK